MVATLERDSPSLQDDDGSMEVQSVQLIFRLERTDWHNHINSPVLLLMRCHAVPCDANAYALGMQASVSREANSTSSQTPARRVSGRLLLCYTCATTNCLCEPWDCVSRNNVVRLCLLLLILPSRGPYCCANLVSYRCPPHETSFKSDTKDEARRG